MSALGMRDKVSKLRNELIDVMERFGMENPEIPAQVLMAGLGELLIQFSVGQVGPGMTSKFLDDLKEAVQIFSLGQSSTDSSCGYPVSVQQRYTHQFFMTSENYAKLLSRK